MPLHTGGIWKVTPTLICLNRLINASLWARNVGSIHAVFHSQHIPSSAAAWRNMSHALGTSSRAFLELSSVSLIQSFPFFAVVESCTQCHCGASDVFHVPGVFIPIVLTKHLVQLPHSKAGQKWRQVEKPAPEHFCLLLRSVHQRQAEGSHPNSWKAASCRAHVSLSWWEPSRTWHRQRCPWFLVCRSGQGMALQLCSPCGGSASSGTFAAVCGLRKEFFYRVRAVYTRTHWVF